MAQVSLTTLIADARSGRLVSFPTDTVPALAVLPDRADQLFITKQRDGSKPLILMGATLETLWDYVMGSEQERRIWQQVATRYLPGALTLVLPASSLVPRVMNPQDPSTIGVRVPDHAIAQAILQETGPLATTSANLSSQPTLRTMAEIAAQFPDVSTLSSLETETVPGSEAASGIPSTVIQWSGESWKVLRQGAILFDAAVGV
ncbi:MAG: L-threonylcarbamoyladenylate synthase [Scytolyngbya sp. HA4215-MV1]|jgi:L-threonylcarbamoyladenylate synthase|nr:L-threonylcarbamoyladenylate synthase [Scytolyngbya sp. HA4215-MV1]